MWKWVIITVLTLIVLIVLYFALSPHNELTVVSGYWKIKSKHTDDEYDKWFNNTLSLNSPYVFFYDDEFTKERISKFRGQIPTTYIKRPISSFTSSKSYKDSWVHDVHVPTPELGKIWIEKVAMMNEAIKINPYKSDWFAWVDAGNAYYRDDKPPSYPWPSSNILSKLPKDKIVYVGTNVKEHDFAGAVFIYHKNIAEKVHQLFFEQYSLCSVEHDDWQCGHDQCIFTDLKKRHPDLFHRMGDGYGGNLLSFIK